MFMVQGWTQLGELVAKFLLGSKALPVFRVFIKDYINYEGMEGIFSIWGLYKRQEDKLNNLPSHPGYRD